MHKLRHNFKKHKYGATPKKVDGINFPSKLEAQVYIKLKSLQDDGKILFFIRQPPFDLPGNSIHRVDFLTFTQTEAIFVEVKGRDLPMGKMKRRQVEAIYGIHIHVVRKVSELNNIFGSSGTEI